MRTTAFVAVLLTAVACGPEDVGLGPGTGDDLDTPSEWLLVDGVPMVADYPITLRLEEGRVGGVAACNNYGGDAVVAGGRFEMRDIAVTEMGCPEPGVHDSETAYIDALLAVERYERADQLVLLGPDVELRFEEVEPPEDAELTGTRWQLESLVTGTGPDGSVSSTMAPGWLRLDDDGTFAASDGCNELAGRWSLEGDMLRVADLSTTDMACPGLEQQASHVADVLTADPVLEHEGRRLRLTTDDLGLDYRAD